MRVDAATYGVGGVKERGMEVEREGGGQYQALPKGMFPTTVNVNVDREARRREEFAAAVGETRESRSFVAPAYARKRY